MLERHQNSDALAHFLMDLGRRAAALPPTWDGARISQPVSGPQGEYVGQMLPGKGLLLADDLKNYGIRRSLPNVYERSLAYRLRDLLGSERGAISSYSDLLAARASGKHGFNGWFSRNVSLSTTSWAHSFLNTTSPNYPSLGSYTAIPGGSAKDQTSTGALNFGWSHPTNPDKAYIISFGLGTVGSGIKIGCLIDLLVAAGAIDANLNTAQTINTTALTRYTSGAGVMLWMECTTAFGATPATITVNKYTNQAGTTLQASPVHTAIAGQAANRAASSTLQPFFALQAGDYGVRSVEEITFSAAMGVGSVAAIVLCMPLLWIPSLPATMYAKRDDTANINGAVELALTSGDLIGCLSLLALGVVSASVLYAGEIEIAVG